MMIPMQMVRTADPTGPAQGSAIVKGSAPSIENQIIGRCPYRSVSRPPRTVPVLTETDIKNFEKKNEPEAKAEKPNKKKKVKGKK